MTSREDSVLASRDPSLTDENDWEEFSLTEVRVLVPGKSRYANLLAASEDNPVQVTGTLEEVEEEQERLVLDPDYLAKRIVLDNVTHYAYGQHNDGEVGFWVAGRAGWFSISPARGYRPMFNDVVEAIDLLYFLADRHQSKRRKGKNWNPSVEYLCEEYVNHTHGICEDGDDSAEVFYKHRAFLLSRMLKGEEGVQWTNTSIFEHLCDKFPEDYEQIKALQEPPENDQYAEKDQEDDVKPESKAHSLDPTAVPKTQADTVYQVILGLKEAGHLAKRQLNLHLVASTLVERYEIGSVEYAQDMIASRADTILGLMDDAKTSNFDWSRKVIYRELKAAAKKNGLQHVTLTPLRPRSSDDAESEEDSDNEEDQPKQRKRRVRKSVLRPKSSVATKQTGKRTRHIATEEEDLSDDNPDAMEEFATPSKVRGHDLIRDPLSTRTKRRTRSILSDSESNSFQKTPLQDTLQSRNNSVSLADQDPSDADAPKGDHDGVSSDTWMCQIRGCGKVVYKSSTKRGKEMIQDHSLAHADDTKAKVDLVFAEHRLNIGVRVDHLLSHIQGIGTLDGLPDINGGPSETNGTAGIGA
ncbi:hypothetical protein EYZ11_002388 [Aspergillus tanneri]|uniref:DNA (cytosine-5)-methyltransferase 1 replication foci domain-containing protein n=1 Tax=Aspergillus tanneri TaxID=1220188 RepID=A0A4V3UQD3_9EURO|nr:uncharacterized protein ATNIH1004_001475 [Aspergillus tanneri]KAA8652570.1 hypothetical protein ATNIH1004_001475 [Aspergillus tanneri]THC98164.1 hypothetical protein EYZ11_002388 [Aspergillus tanneri]